LQAAGISSAGYVSGEVSAPAEDPEENFLYNKPIADWQRVLDVNLTGVAITDRLAARHMLALEAGGSIINIASIAGKRPYRAPRLLRVQGRRNYVDNCFCYGARPLKIFV
jgi:NAD(P)-dependent dehydrogenase (short-subunit alcohol dehydrogenase family)